MKESGARSAEAALARRTPGGAVHVVDLEPEVDDFPASASEEKAPSPGARRRTGKPRAHRSRCHHAVPRPEQRRLAALIADLG